MATKSPKSIISSFNLTEFHKHQAADKPAERRNKLLLKLNEKILTVQAKLKGEEYFV